MGVKILSLYDGMACGMIDMQLAGVEVESYDAYEIDKYAIKTAQHNFPMIKEHGDVFDADFTQYEGVDFLIGGSPCTYWSIAQTKNRETVASGMGWELFSQYVRALHEAKPKYFIYENNKSMSKQIRASIDEAFGFEAVLINSALVSAQNRQRLYWVGKRNDDGTYSKVNVEQPADRGILLKDVLDNAVAMSEKAHTIDANYYKGGNFTSPNKQSGKRLMDAEPINTDANGKSFCVTSRYYKGFGNNPGKCLEKHRDSMAAEPLVTTKNGKSFAITANYVHIQDYPNDYAAHTIEKSVKPLVAEPVACRCRGRVDTSGNGYAKYECREDGKSNTLDTNTTNGAMVAEPVCLRYERTEEAKRCRKAYEAHEIKHGYNELNELHPRPDGKTNTLTTVLKDNQIMVPLQYEELSDEYYKGCADGNLVGMIENEGKYKNGKQPSQQYRVYSCEDKSVCVDADQRKHYIIPYAIEFDDDGIPIKTIGKDGKEITIYEVCDGKITIKGKQYPIKLEDGFYIIRKLTVSECKRLQTVPEWYEFPVSNSQAYKMLGNGWTCEVICHLINSCFKSTDILPGQIEMEGFDG